MKQVETESTYSDRRGLCVPTTLLISRYNHILELNLRNHEGPLAFMCIIIFRLSMEPIIEMNITILVTRYLGKWG